MFASVTTHKNGQELMNKWERYDDGVLDVQSMQSQNRNLFGAGVPDQVINDHRYYNSPAYFDKDNGEQKFVISRGQEAWV